MIVNFSQLSKDLQKRDFKPVYILYGDEPFYIDKASDFMIDTVLDETEKAFNEFVMYGRDTSAPTLVDYCRRFPMMGNYQLVVLREAQDMDIKKDESVQFLISYLRNPSPNTILVLGYKYKSPPIKLMNVAKKEEKSVVLFESKRKGENDLPVWISEQVRENGYSITTKASIMLQEYLGNNLEKISNELGKLYINLPKDKQITEDIIENNIGISKDYNINELQKAIARKDVFKANQIVNYFAANPKENPIFKVIPILLGFFTKTLIIHSLDKKTEEEIAAKLKMGSYFAKDYIQASNNYSPTKLQDIVSWLREANVKALGVDNYSVENGELMKELIFKILH